MSGTEAATRDAIVEYGRLLWDRRLVTGTSGNISARLDDGFLLVTPSSVSLRSLQPEALVKVAATGEIVEGHSRPTTELPLHLAAYRARPEVRCVVHTHPTMCVVWTKSFSGTFERDTVGARETLGEVAWTAYAAPGSEELANSSSAAFASGVDVVLMERHGLSVVAGSLERAFNLTDLAEEAARIACFSRTLR